MEKICTVSDNFVVGGLSSFVPVRPFPIIRSRLLEFIRSYKLLEVDNPIRPAFNRRDYASTTLCYC